MPGESEDEKIWRQFAAEVRPLEKRKAAAFSLTVRTNRGAVTKDGVSESPDGEFRRPRGQDTASLDGNTARRLAKGKIEPDRRLDLHGQTLDQAWRALESELASCTARGARLLLVITGRGGKKLASVRDPRPGEIRRAFPGWVRSSQHAERIVTVQQAHRTHGGEGAFYVYLKKRRIRGSAR